MNFSDIPIRTNAATDGVDASWWNSLRQAGIDVFEGHTLSAIANNQSAANVASLLLDNTSIKVAFIEYYVKRIATSTVFEVGKLVAWYNGTSWQIQRVWYVDNANIDFTIDASSGQVKYTTDNMSGSYDTANSKMNWRYSSLGA